MTPLSCTCPCLRSINIFDLQLSFKIALVKVKTKSIYIFKTQQKHYAENDQIVPLLRTLHMTQSHFASHGPGLWTSKAFGSLC